MPGANDAKTIQVALIQQAFSVGAFIMSGIEIPIDVVNRNIFPIYRHQPDLPEATRHMEHSLALAEEMGQPAARVAALNNLSLAYADRGDLEQAISYASQALDLCIHLGDRHRAAALHNNLADLYHVAGCETEAIAHLKQAVVIFAEVGGDMTYQDMEWANSEIWKLTEW